jgi:hypothetical protein
VDTFKSELKIKFTVHRVTPSTQLSNSVTNWVLEIQHGKNAKTKPWAAASSCHRTAPNKTTMIISNLHLLTCPQKQTLTELLSMMSEWNL